MLLDILFPKTCAGCGKQGFYLCPRCISIFPQVRLICPMCRKGSIAGVTHCHCRRSLGMDGLVSVFPYKGGIQSLIKQMKYRFVSEMGASFVEVVVKRVDLGVVDFFRRENFVVMPVPLHKIRERWRGFNQAALLGKLLAEYWQLVYQPKLLRVKNTDALAEIKSRLTSFERNELKEKYKSVTQRKMVEQQLLKRKREQTRKHQMRGAFELNSKFKMQNVKILLVDDVWTSGATLLECAKVLKKKGSDKVWGFTFARSGG